MEKRNSVYDRYSDIRLKVYVDQSKLSRLVFTVYYYSEEKKVLTVTVNKWGDWIEAHDCDYGDVFVSAQELYYARKAIKDDLNDLYLHMKTCLSQTDYKEEE